MNGLKKKRVLITGANGCLGKSIAERLIAEKCNLVLTDKVKIELAFRSAAQEVTEVLGDISKPDDVANILAVVKDTLGGLGGLDGLVNTAAILEPQDGSITKTTLESFQRTLATNLLGTFLTCQAVIPLMLESGNGSIVNLSSVVAHVASAEAQIAYTASKGGVEALTREIAIEQARSGIRANCIASGPVLSARNKHYFDTDEKWQARRKHIPMGRLGRPEEIAGVVAFLLSDDAAYMTGSTLLVDGGIASAYVINDVNGSPTP